MRRLASFMLLSLAAASLAFAQPQGARIFLAQLSGAEEVPPNASRAHGNAHFRLDDEGLHYRLNVANLENVIAAHIHLGPRGENGPVAAFLFGPAAPGGGRSNGKLSEGVIRAADLVGPLAGQTLASLLDALAAGDAYVNVHTDDGQGEAGTGPGDLPAGEIRGQIEARGGGKR